MSLGHLNAPRADGPLFVSRTILVVSAAIIWAISFVATTTSLDGSSTDNIRLSALVCDLVGFALAFFASDPKTPRRYLPLIRLFWLASSVASGIMTAQAVTLTSGFTSLAFNVLLGTALVFLVSMRWDLLGFLLLVAANSVLSGLYYATTPRFGSGEGLLIFFMTLMPGLVGALTVFIIRSQADGQRARQTIEALNALTEHADSRDSAWSEELAKTHEQIQQLFARVAEARHLPTDPHLSEQAQALAGQLRAQLTLARATSWLTESLAVAGLEPAITVVAQPDQVERIPHTSRSAVVAVTMLLATPVPAPACGAPPSAAKDEPRRLHVFVEPQLEDKVLITWRVTNLRPNRCTPALWTELESLGVPRVHTDPQGASIMVQVKAPRAW